MRKMRRYRRRGRCGDAELLLSAQHHRDYEYWRHTLHTGATHSLRLRSCNQMERTTTKYRMGVYIAVPPTPIFIDIDSCISPMPRTYLIPLYLVAHTHPPPQKPFPRRSLNPKPLSSMSDLATASIIAKTTRPQPKHKRF